MKPIEVIGLGMGPTDVSEAMRGLIAGAEVLAGGRRLLGWFPEYPGRRLVLAGGMEEWMASVAEAAQNEKVAVLASGDPGFFGIAARLAGRLGRAALRIHPNVTAVQAAFARLGRPWQEARVVSLHGRGLDGLWPALRGAEAVAVFTDPENTPARLAAAMLAQGQAGWRLFVAEELGAPGERCGEYSLAQAAERGFAPLNLAVLLRTSEPEPLHLGLPEEAYDHQAGLITKAEVRAVALARLRLRPGLTLWDLGAGCGSVGIEACLLLPGGRVYAVEKDPGRAAQIEANRARFGAAELSVLRAELPAGLEGLPDPDRVFVGGGGAALGQIVAACLDRLRPGGVLVASAVRLGAVQAAREAIAAAGLPAEAVQVAIGRSAELAGDLYLKALNPVWLVGACKPGEAT